MEAHTLHLNGDSCIKVQGVGEPTGQMVDIETVLPLARPRKEVPLHVWARGAISSLVRAYQTDDPPALVELRRHWYSVVQQDHETGAFLREKERLVALSASTLDYFTDLATPAHAAQIAADRKSVDEGCQASALTWRSLLQEWGAALRSLRDDCARLRERAWSASAGVNSAREELEQCVRDGGVAPHWRAVVGDVIEAEFQRSRHAIFSEFDTAVARLRAAAAAAVEKAEAPGRPVFAVRSDSPHVQAYRFAREECLRAQVMMSMMQMLERLSECVGCPPFSSPAGVTR